MRRVDRLQIRGKTQTRGLTLLELSVVLALIGVIAAGSMAMLTASIQSSQYNMTVARMQAIEAALLNFRTAFTRLPCPGDLTVVPTDATTGTYYNSTKGEDYGLEAGADAKSAIAAATGACTGTNMTPQANFTAAGTNTGSNAYTVAEGAVPTRALQLPDSYMYDGWGNKFRYAVDVAFTASNVFNTYLPTPGICAYGGITVNDSTGAARSSVSIYALVSHGANGHGAYTASASIINGGSTNADEQTNCSCDSTGAHTGGAGVFTSNFVQKLPSTTTVGNALTIFDDIVDFRERWQMQAPMGDNTGACIYIAVVDTYNIRVQLFNSNGTYLRQFGSTYSTGPGQFEYPLDVAFDASGSIWVADWSANRVQKFDLNGTYQNVALGTGYNGVGGTIGSSGSGNGQFNNPIGVTFDPSGSIWVADGRNYRVQKFDKNGNYLSQFGSAGTNPGQFDPAYGPVVKVAFDGAGSIWVESTHPFLQKFNSSGSYILNACDWPQCNDGKMVASDASGNLWKTEGVANAPLYAVEEYNPSGTEQTTFGATTGIGNGQFNGATGIALDSSGSIWVVDQFNARVQKFNSSGAFLLGIGSGYNGVPGAIGSGGSGPGQFGNCGGGCGPYGIAAGTISR